MKTNYKKILSVAFTGLLGLFLALPVMAQRGGRSGGGGGGGRSSGGGGFSHGGGGGFSRPSGGGSFSRPSGGSFNRPSGGGRQNNGHAIAPQRGFSQNYGGRTGIAPNRGGFTGRQGNYSRGSAGYGVRGFAGRPGYAYRGGNYGRGTFAYRGGNYGRGFGYRGGYGGRYFNRGFYNYRGYYNSYYLPRIGFSIGVLPFGYYPFFYGNYQYYYSDGLYYQQNDNQYTVVEPPVGAQVNALPSKAQQITINGEQFYESNGVYYRAVTKDDGTVVYEVAGKDGELNTDGASVDNDDYQPYQMGDIVKELPQDSRKIKVNGEKLFVAPDGTYFQETRDENNEKVYKVVGLPTEEEPADNNQ